MTPDGLPDDYIPVFLPPSVYDAAKAQGYDMRYFARTKLIPQTGDGLIFRRVVSCTINGRHFPGGTLADWNRWVMSR